MITTEELDALETLRECATPAPWKHNMWRSHEDCDTLQWCAIGPAHDVVGNDKEDDDSTAYGAAAVDADYLTDLVNAAPRLLAAAREAETLRAKLAETEQARHEARYYGNQVAAERDSLQSRLNQAEHAAKVLTARLAESEKTATRYRRLFEGRCLDCNNLDPVHAPDCVHVAGKAAR